MTVAFSIVLNASMHVVLSAITLFVIPPPQVWGGVRIEVSMVVIAWLLAAVSIFDMPNTVTDKVIMTVSFLCGCHRISDHVAWMQCMPDVGSMCQWGVPLLAILKCACHVLNSPSFPPAAAPAAAAPPEPEPAPAAVPALAAAPASAVPPEPECITMQGETCICYQQNIGTLSIIRYTTTPEANNSNSTCTKLSNDGGGLITNCYRYRLVCDCMDDDEYED